MIGDSYTTSTDYQRLWELTAQHHVVCFVDFGTRQIAEARRHGGLVLVGSRGVCYLFNETLADFVRDCEQLKLSYLAPIAAVRTRMTYTAYHAGQFEDARLREQWPECPDIGTFLDVGAGDGIDASNSLHFQRNGWTGLLIEGDRRQLERLRRNRPGEQIVEAVIARRTGQVEFFLADHLDHSGLKPHRPDFPRELRDGITLPDLLVSLGHRDTVWDLLSIDTEGTELDIWESLVESGLQLPRSLIIEHEHTGVAVDRIISDIEGQGYRLIDRNRVNLTFVLTRKP